MPDFRSLNRNYVARAAASAAVAIIAASPAHAQQSEPRWLPFAGCWTPDRSTVPVGASATSGSMVCVVPVPNTANADIATIANNRVIYRERVNAGNDRTAKTMDNCPGWQSAKWSADGNRLFLRSEYACRDSLTVKGSTVFSISPEGNWIQVQGSTVGQSAGARILRFRPSDLMLAQGTLLADSALVNTVPAESGFAQQSLRTAAGGIPTTDAVLDVSKNVDVQVAQAWLTELGRPARLSAKELVGLADGGMAPSMIDLMVAMAYPERFQLQQRQPVTDNQARPTAMDIANANVSSACSMGMSVYMSRLELLQCMRYSANFGLSPFGYGMGGLGGLSAYGLGYGYGAGYGFGNGFGRNYYYGQNPIIIVTRGSDNGGTIPPQGRAVKGGGYTRDMSSTPTTTRTSSGSSSSGSTSGGNAGSTSSGSSGSTSSGSSSSTGTGRTAMPRTPPPIN